MPTSHGGDLHKEHLRARQLMWTLKTPILTASARHLQLYKTTLQNTETAIMESLLSVSFDNISSRDSTKIRKGLRQIEGVLAQICLSKPKSQSPHKRKSSVLSDKQQASPKKLSELKDDPAFREFFRLQEGFQCNGTETRRYEQTSQKKS